MLNNNKIIGYTRYNIPVYEIIDATNILCFSRILVSIYNNEILGVIGVCSHSELLYAIHTDKTVDDYIRFHTVNKNGVRTLVTDINRAGIVINSEDDRIMVIDRIHLAIDKLKKIKLPYNVKIIIYNSNKHIDRNII